MSKAVDALREGMKLCPPEFSTSTALKAVWLAGFITGYRYKQEEKDDD